MGGGIFNRHYGDFCTGADRGKRRCVEVTARRTKVDFVAFVKNLLETVYAIALTVHIVLDDLNTHFRQTFVDVLGEKAAAAVLQRVQFHYTPKHASWLNMAEIEIGVIITGAALMFSDPPEFCPAPPMKTFPVTMFRNYFVSILATRAPLRRVAVLTPEFWRPTTNTRASASPARLRPVNAPDEAATMSAGGGRHGRSCETNLVSLGAGFSWEMPPGELASVAWLRARLRRELGRARLVVGSY